MFPWGKASTCFSFPRGNWLLCSYSLGSYLQKMESWSGQNSNKTLQERLWLQSGPVYLEIHKLFCKFPPRDFIYLNLKTVHENVCFAQTKCILGAYSHMEWIIIPFYRWGNRLVSRGAEYKPLYFLLDSSSSYILCCLLLSHSEVERCTPFRPLFGFIRRWSWWWFSPQESSHVFYQEKLYQRTEHVESCEGVDRGKGRACTLDNGHSIEGILLRGGKCY